MSATQLALGTVGFGSFEFTGGGTLINLVAATTNAPCSPVGPTTTRTSP
ncbi:hypothetical protein [Streptomyces sp. NPDC091879]